MRNFTSKVLVFLYDAEGSELFKWHYINTFALSAL